MDYQKNQIIETYIEDMSDNGEGIGKIDGYTLFVKDTVIGDRAKVRITKAKKNYGFGRLEEIIRPSRNRVEPVCCLHRKCGGCNLQSMSYEAQLAFKEKKVRESLTRIGGFDKEFIEGIMDPVIGTEHPLRYRNKAQFPVGYDNMRNAISGFYTSRTHDIVGCNECYLISKDCLEITKILTDHFNKYKIIPYDEKDGSGLVRHILIRKGFHTGEIILCLILNSGEIEAPSKNQRSEGRISKKDEASGNNLNKDIIKIKQTNSPDNVRKFVPEYLPHQAELIERVKAVKGVKSICVNLNNERTNVILGRKTVTLWGDDAIRDKLMDLEFEISAESFYQVNPEQTEKLYGLVREYAALSGKEEVWDICCGIGTITLMLAKDAVRVHGIEIVPQAIENAEKNARINKISNSEFICGAAEEILPELKNGIRADVIVMDPPRKGMDERALRVVADTEPEKIIYVSCDPATLARDLKFLAGCGYIPVRIRPVDMFPQTIHVEVVSLLQKMSNTRSKEITLDVDMEEYHRIMNRTEVTSDATE